ncbi:NTP transferase domain-containing protein [Streptomyces sp. 4N509B]|uniref:NTP transferase domain-containing protein n=1 Tax=Streptomyces sp. 4N509B TaxID=3457413 RepID=UPI003FD13999
MTVLRDPDTPPTPDEPASDAAPDAGFDAGFDAVVLAGGAARRLGGADKPAVRVGGRTLLGRVLDACAEAGRVVVVGPRRATDPATGRVPRWAREDPPGGGPVAGIAAGLRHVDRPLVAVLAADLPFLTTQTLRRLSAVPPGADGLLLRDAEGREQPLAAVYRTASLRRALAAVAAGETAAPAGAGGPLSGVAVKRLLPHLTLGHLDAGEDATDCDTWSDIATARARIGDDGTVLDEWIAAARVELGIAPATEPDLDVDTTALLDAARDAAHGVARPAAPLTTFLIGYAMARHGIGQAEAARRVAELAARWGREREAGREGQAKGQAKDQAKEQEQGQGQPSGEAR